MRDRELTDAAVRRPLGEGVQTAAGGQMKDRLAVPVGEGCLDDDDVRIAVAIDAAPDPADVRRLRLDADDTASRTELARRHEREVALVPADVHERPAHGRYRRNAAVLAGSYTPSALASMAGDSRTSR